MPEPESAAVPVILTVPLITPPEGMPATLTVATGLSVSTMTVRPGLVAASARAAERME